MDAQLRNRLAEVLAEALGWSIDDCDEVWEYQEGGFNANFKVRRQQTTAVVRLNNARRRHRESFRDFEELAIRHAEGCGLAPCVFKVTPGYLVRGHVEGVKPTPENLRDPAFQACLFGKLRQFHAWKPKDPPRGSIFTPCRSYIEERFAAAGIAVPGAYRAAWQFVEASQAEVEAFQPKGSIAHCDLTPNNMFVICAGGVIVDVKVIDYETCRWESFYRDLARLVQSAKMECDTAAVAAMAERYGLAAADDEVRHILVRTMSSLFLESVVFYLRANQPGGKTERLLQANAGIDRLTALAGFLGF